MAIARMNWHRVAGFAVTAIVVLTGTVARAGMPAPLPSDFETVSRLTDTAYGRVQAISFFVVGVLLSALIVKLLWNSIQRDFPRMPRLRYFSALAGTLLWGLAFVIVLTMIAGARELMTPGAWEKRGMTYKLAGSRAESSSPPSVDPREERLQELGIEFLRFAATHDGDYPDTPGELAISEELLNVPGYRGLQYIVVSGRTSAQEGRVLAYEPEIDHDRRLVRTTDGQVKTMTTDELTRELKEPASP